MATASCNPWQPYPLATMVMVSKRLGDTHYRLEILSGCKPCWTLNRTTRTVSATSTQTSLEKAW